jgi:hypothetical protein
MTLYDGPEAADFWRYRKAKIQDRQGKTGDVEIKKTYLLPSMEFSQAYAHVIR